MSNKALYLNYKGYKYSSVLWSVFICLVFVYVSVSLLSHYPVHLGPSPHNSITKRNRKNLPHWDPAQRTCLLVTITMKIFLLSFWSQNSEFAHRHSDDSTPFQQPLFPSLPASPRSLLDTFPYTPPVPSLLSPTFLNPLSPAPVWLSVPGIMAPEVGVGGLIVQKH